MKIIKFFIRLAVVVLVALLVFLDGWMKGYDLGYEAALANVILKKVDPHRYMCKKFKIPRCNKR